MMLSQAIATAVLGAIAANGTFVSRDVGIPTPDDGYTISEFTFNAPITEGGENVTFVGTAEDVVHQIMEVNPEYQPLPIGRDWEHDDIVLDCDPADWLKSAGWDQLEEEMKYLEKLGDTPCNAGPGDCTRISCSYNTAVWMCNGKDENTGPTCGQAAKDVLHIAQNCNVFNSDHNEYDVKGLLYETVNKYNIWVGKSKC